jgi:hypothetical protein
MEHQENLRRQRLINYIRSKNPFLMFSPLDHYSIEMLEKFKADIDEEIKALRKDRMNYLLN